MSVNIEIAAVVEIMQQEFPREYTICLQRAHIAKLEELLAAAQVEAVDESSHNVQ